MKLEIRSVVGSEDKNRVRNPQWVLKPQDLVVALKLHTLGSTVLPYARLGAALFMSQFEAHAAVQRLLAAGLVTRMAGRTRPVIASLRNFIINGAIYAYPAVHGEVTIGVPTAQAVAPLKDLLVGTSEMPPVWPDAHGETRGQALMPLYPTVPRAVQTDPALWELLALFDALRIGQARERNLAGRLLEERLA
jgi:hypothetical protein